MKVTTAHRHVMCGNDRTGLCWPTGQASRLMLPTSPTGNPLPNGLLPCIGSVSLPSFDKY